MLKDKTALIKDLEMLYTLSEEELASISGEVGKWICTRIEKGKGCTRWERKLLIGGNPYIEIKTNGIQRVAGDSMNPEVKEF